MNARLLLLAGLFACGPDEVDVNGRWEDDGGAPTDGGGGSDGSDGASDDGSDGASDDGGDGASDDGSDGSDGGTVSCELVEAYPRDGATDAYYRGAVEFVVQGEPGRSSVSIDGRTGTVTIRENSGSTSTLVYQDDAPLDPETTYTAVVTTCDGSITTSITFTTSSLGTSTSGCDLTGRAWSLNLVDARFLEPQGVGNLFISQLEEDLLFGVSAQGSDELALRGAFSTSTGSETQDTCEPTEEFGWATFVNPHFSVTSADAALNMAGVAISLGPLTLEGDVSRDCSTLGGMRIAGNLDARDLAPTVGELLGSDDPDELCSYLVGFGITCETCADGEPYCVPLLLDQVAGSAIGSPLACVAMEDCHPECSRSSCEDPDAGVCD